MVHGGDINDKHDVWKTQDCPCMLPLLFEEENWSNAGKQLEKLLKVKSGFHFAHSSQMTPSTYLVQQRGNTHQQDIKLYNCVCLRHKDSRDAKPLGPEVECRKKP